MSLDNKKTIVREEVDVQEIVDKVIEELKRKKIPTKRLLEDLPATIQVKWKDKKKGLIICNRCSGTGREEAPYGNTRECRFCEGKKVIKLNQS